MGRRFQRRSVLFGVLTCATWLAISPALAQTFNWSPALTGNQSWTVDGNWDQSGYPNSAMHVANLSVPLASSLNVRITNGVNTLAGLKLGGTATGVATDVQADFGTQLVFQNDDNSLNGGIPLITSAGVAGSTNLISASTLLNEQLDFSSASTNNVVVSGQVTAAGTAPSIRSFMPTGLSARIERLDITDPANPGNYRQFRLNESAGSPAGMPTISTQGTLELGEITGYGEIRIGVTASQHPVPLGTVVLRGENSMVGYIQLNRANVVLGHDNSLGIYGIFGGQPNQGVGVNLISDNDARTESGIAEISQWFTIKGEHSLTWNGLVVQTNSRGWINLLPAGKTFTLGGEVYAVADEDTERTFSFDGTGRTVVTGGLHDKFVFGEGPSLNGTGSYRKTGTGSVFVTGSVSTYHGTTIVEAGTLRFNNATHLTDSSEIVSTGGAIGVDTGIFSNANVLAKFDAADTGGVMLSLAEASANLDFTTGDLTTAPNVSIAAPEEGITYDGTITPAGSNYRLGGGTGTLTMPLQNQLTGARGLVVTNGGEVRLTATNNYTGSTVISDNAFTSRTNQAIADVTSGISQSLFAPTTLTVSSLKSGGVESSIGTSSNDASNLVIQGSKLRIDGTTETTQRLFTIGSRGATIETVGATRASFENAGPLAIEPAGATAVRTLTLASESSGNGMRPLIQNAPDGGVVGVTKIGPGTWNLWNDNTYSGLTHVHAGGLSIGGNHTGTGEVRVDAGAHLTGYGAVGGNVTVAGTLSSDDDFNIGGNLGLLASSTTFVHIGALFIPGYHTRVDVAGTAAIDGTLNIFGQFQSLAGTIYDPKPGDEFTVLTAAGGITGSYKHVESNLSSFYPQFRWEIRQGAFDLTLRVVAVPEPTCLTLFALAAACTVSTRRRRPTPVSVAT